MVKYITTKQALSQVDKYITISYVWHQHDSIYPIEQKVEKIIKDDYFKQFVNENGNNNVWLDKISNICTDDFSSKEGIKYMNEVYAGASCTLAVLPEVECCRSLQYDIQEEVAKCISHLPKLWSESSEEVELYDKQYKIKTEKEKII